MKKLLELSKKFLQKIEKDLKQEPSPDQNRQ